MYEEVRLVIIGKTGSGKSATGNTILGEPLFKSTISGSSITRDCSQHFVERFGRKIVIVDTPGIFDTEENNEKIQEEIYKCIGITSPGPHAFIFVINAAARYTEEEQRSVEHFVNYFGNEIYKYFIVLFVRKDELDEHKIQLTDHIQNSPPILKQFIQKCGGRVCAFNNKASGKEQDTQIKNLLQKISENIEKNGGKCYTNEMYIEAEKQIKIKEEERLAKEKERRDKELQSIKTMISEDYNKKLDQEKKNRQVLQKTLDELVEKQRSKEADLQSQISFYEHMIKEKKGDKEQLMKQFELMNAEVAKNREYNLEETRLIEQYRRDIEKSQEEKDRLKREHEIEKQNLQREYEDNIKAERERIRDEFREHVKEELEEFKRSHRAEMAEKQSRESKKSFCPIM